MIFAGYDETELEWQYSPILWEEGAETTLEGWRRRGREHIATHEVRLDLRYSTAEDARLDLYLPDTAEPRPLAIFIHGGYWQMMDKADHGQFLKGILDAGFAVAVLNYSLCPVVSIAEIAEQIGEARSWLQAHARDLGYSDSGAVVIGHSAGAHLGALMCVGEQGEPNKGFLGGFLGISGLYDLTPLLLLPVAATLGLQGVGGFRGLSPVMLTPPAGLRAVVAVGALESNEFKLQTEQFAAQWSTHLGTVGLIEVSDVAHFAVMEHLVQGELLDAALDLLARA
ncbi:MAG: alpha/beta hydrolase [Leucobacter sp.]